MKSHLYVSLAILLGLFTTTPQDNRPAKALTQETQESSTSAQTTTESATKEAQEAESNLEQKKIDVEVETIMELRKKFGSVASSLGDDFQLDFDAAGTVKSETGSSDTTARQSASLDDAFRKHLREKLQKNHVANLPPQINPSQPIPLDRTDVDTAVAHAEKTASQKRQIRDAARMLEQAAAILEEANEFRHADSVRGSASKLWRSAR